MSGEETLAPIETTTPDIEPSKKYTLIEVQLLKDAANRLFGEQKFTEAESCYQEILTTLNSLEHGVEDEKIKELTIIIKSNLAACFLKLASFERAKQECTEVLELDPKNVKCLLRRAKAHESLENYEEAIKDLKIALEIQPDSDATKESLAKLDELQKTKAKEEMEKMMGQLKGLGNQFLGLFGMSTDNFKFEQNPETGGYSVNMNNGKKEENK
jgi:valyl-tRNA synthetase